MNNRADVSMRRPMGSILGSAAMPIFRRGGYAPHTSVAEPHFALALNQTFG